MAHGGISEAIHDSFPLKEKVYHMSGRTVKNQCEKLRV